MPMRGQEPPRVCENLSSCDPAMLMRRMDLSSVLLMTRLCMRYALEKSSITRSSHADERYRALKCSTVTTPSRAGSPRLSNWYGMSSAKILHQAPMPMRGRAPSSQIRPLSRPPCSHPVDGLGRFRFSPVALSSSSSPVSDVDIAMSRLTCRPGSQLPCSHAVDRLGRFRLSPIAHSSSSSPFLMHLSLCLV